MTPAGFNKSWYERARAILFHPHRGLSCLSLPYQLSVPTEQREWQAGHCRDLSPVILDHLNIGTVDVVPILARIR
jgi:hypothetical protein